MRGFQVRTILLMLCLWLAVASAAMAGDAMHFKDADIRDVLHALGELGNINVVVDSRVQGSVSVFLRGFDPVEAIDLVTRTNGYSFHWVNDRTIVVGPEPWITERFEPVQTAFFPLRYTKPEAVAASLSLVVQPAVVRPDAAHGGVLVRGTREQLDLAEGFLRQLDVPPRVELDFVDADVLTVFHELALAGGYNLLLESPLYGTITIVLQDIDVDEAIRLAARQSGVKYRFEGNSLIVAMDPPSRAVVSAMATVSPVPAVDQDSVSASSGGAVSDEGGDGDLARTLDSEGTFDPIVLRVLTLYYIDPSQAQRLVAAMVPTQAIQVEVVGSALVMRGPEAVLHEAEALLAEFDVPQVRVDGIVLRGEQRLAVVSVGANSYVVKSGDVVQNLAVVNVDDAGVDFRTVRDQTLHVAIGGARN